jgi:FKBP-type peptidyl-prolyl cis-trans isomerase FklB
LPEYSSSAKNNRVAEIYQHCSKKIIPAVCFAALKNKIAFSISFRKNAQHRFKSMKTIILAVIFSTGAVAPVFADGTNSLPDEKSRISYAAGMMTGHSWKQQDLDFDVDLYAQGIKDEQSGSATLLTQQQAQETITAFRKEMVAKQQQKRIELAAINKAQGEAFLATNKNNPGVVTLPDGLQYQIITNGTGTMPLSNDIVTVNYSGTLLDGTEFDSSYKRGKPAQFPVGRVIHGWTEALMKMTIGSKWKLFIPAELAYGEQGRMGIPPNATLIFEVELLDAKIPTPPPPLTSDIIKVPSAEEMKNGAKIETIKPEDVQTMQSQTKTN